VSGIRRREVIAGLGSAAAWPVVTWAQQPPMPVIGYLAYGRTPTSPGSSFLEGLAKFGYVPGRNLTIEFRGADFKIRSCHNLPLIWLPIGWR
jgi:putative tryptophan/tyrosine transport system substrate-binding protein